MTMVILAQHLMMVNVATVAMIADGHGLMMTQLSGTPRTLTADAKQVLNLNNSFNEFEIINSIDILVHIYFKNISKC